MTSMKTDTEDSIRVTLTLRRESNPEWYDRLVDVKNGRARADIIRTHLSLPRPVSTSARQPRPDPPATSAAPAVPPPATPQVVAAPAVAPTTVESKAATEPADTTASPPGGGLADLMLVRFGDNGSFPQG